MRDPTSLEQIFGAIVVQGTLEEAAREMASLVASYPELRAEYIEALRSAVQAGESGEAAVAVAVNRSGYQAASPQEAAEYCSELLKCFQSELGSRSL